MKTNGKVKLALVLALSIIVVISIGFHRNRSFKYKEISYKQFLKRVEMNLVEEIRLDGSDKLKGKFKDGEMFTTDNPRKEDFKEFLLLNDIKVVEDGGKGLLNQVLSFLLMLTAIGGVSYIIRNSSKQAEKEMTKMSDVDAATLTEGRVTFADVAGNEEAKESLKELVDFIKDPEKYLNYGARLPRGVLLYGPPGTGKTLLAKALANEANVPFYAVSGSDFVQVYAGLGASRIRGLFKKAKEKGKSVIFIDEIDALGKKRRGANSPSGSEEGDRTLNALLTEMSGFKGNEGIIVLAATNRIDTLDEALLRPGRFDRQIEVGLPDVKARFKILKIHSRNKPLSEDVDLKKVALETVYFSGAKLESLMNESAMIAAKTKAEKITMDHINKAYFKVLVGEEKKDRTGISLEDKKITAYHEAGHALVAKRVSDSIRVTKVSIIPSTKGMGGFSLNIPTDKMYQTKKDIIANIMIALGGRAAEVIVFGKDCITTGASSDLQKATKMVLAMIGSYGMDDELGLLNYDVILNSNLNNDISLINRARDILEKYYHNTIELLEKNRVYLNMIADKLIVKESLEEEELEEILAK